MNSPIDLSTNATHTKYLPKHDRGIENEEPPWPTDPDAYLPTYLPTQQIELAGCILCVAKPNNASIRRRLVEYCDHEGEVVSAL
jgi:hypothetical protein